MKLHFSYSVIIINDIQRTQIINKLVLLNHIVSRYISVDLHQNRFIKINSVAEQSDLNSKVTFLARQISCTIVNCLGVS